MTTVAIRKKLSEYLKVAADKKIKAIYALVEDEIEQSELEYTNELKTELGKRYDNYKKGGKVIGANAVKRKIDKLLAS